MREPVSAYIGLGANLGEPVAQLQWAIEQIGLLPNIFNLRVSHFYRSAPIDSSGPDYINAVAHVQTGLDAHALLSMLQQIEQKGGRVRPYLNAPRTLDLDLLFYGSSRIDSPHLQVPHPRMFERAFVLLPLTELAPGLLTDAQLAAVKDQLCAVN